METNLQPVSPSGVRGLEGEIFAGSTREPDPSFFLFPVGENLATTGYVDPMSMTEDQLGVVSELAHTLAETPFTSAGGRCVELIPGFYLSNGSVAQNLTLLKKHGIGAVLNMAPKEVLTGDDFYSEHDILYQGIEAKDELDADVLEHWPQAREFIEAARTANRKTLIHCRAGINRSGALAIAYVSWKTSTDLIETARTIKSKRYQLCTNDNFQRALVRFSTTHGLLPSPGRSQTLMAMGSSTDLGPTDDISQLSASGAVDACPPPPCTIVFSESVGFPSTAHEQADPTSALKQEQHAALPPLPPAEDVVRALEALKLADSQAVGPSAVGGVAHAMPSAPLS